jgi:Asp-tRNA(Asn)/Glu-tRNA(Gln) amidotransferase A subunit family amidase
MTMTSWVGQTATEIAEAVRDGKATAAEVMAGHLDHIARHDAAIGAFVRVRAAQALAEAEALDQQADKAGLPLAGVPVSVKDTIPVAGEPIRLGSAATPAHPRAADHPLVARLRAAGAVVAGPHQPSRTGHLPVHRQRVRHHKKPFQCGQNGWRIVGRRGCLGRIGDGPARARQR